MGENSCAMAVPWVSVVRGREWGRIGSCSSHGSFTWMWEISSHSLHRVDIRMVLLTLRRPGYTFVLSGNLISLDGWGESQAVPVQVPESVVSSRAIDQGAPIRDARMEKREKMYQRITLGNIGQIFMDGCPLAQVLKAQLMVKLCGENNFQRGDQYWTLLSPKIKATQSQPAWVKTCKKNKTLSILKLEHFAKINSS